MRLRLESYPVIDEMAARYGDMDANAHMNNLALESLHENARATMNHRLLPEAFFAGNSPSGRRLRLVTSQNAVHFLAEAHWPALIRTGAGVGRIGRTSYIASTGLFIDGACIGVCDTVLVLLGDDGPVPIPNDFRAALETMMLGPAVKAGGDGRDESGHISVRIDRSPDEVYRFAADPVNLPRWATGLTAGVTVAFTDPNDLGVLDHVVTLPSGEQVFVPMRVVPIGPTRSEVIFTLRRSRETSDADYRADAAAVAADLDTLKRILERRATAP